MSDRKAGGREWGRGSLMAVSEQSSCKIVLMVKSRLRYSQEGRALQKAEQKSSQSSHSSPVSLPSSLGWVPPCQERSTSVCLANPVAGRNNVF